MKRIIFSLSLIATLGLLFTACNNSNDNSDDINNPSSSLYTIVIEGYDTISTTYAKLEGSAVEIDNLFTSKLIIAGGINADEADQLSSGSYVATEDVAVMTLWVQAQEEKYLSSGTYDYVDITTTTAIEYNFYSADIVYTRKGDNVSTNSKTFSFTSGTMVVVYNDGAYTVTIDAKTKEGTSLKVYYKGAIPFSQLPEP